MQIGIEFLSQRLEFFHPMLIEHLQELALGQFDPIEQRLDAGVRLLPQLRIERRQSAFHVVGDGQDIARKRRNAVDARVRDLARGSPPQVLHLGEHAQELVLVFGRDPRVVRGIDRLGGRRNLANLEEFSAASSAAAAASTEGPELVSVITLFPFANW